MKSVEGVWGMRKANFSRLVWPGLVLATGVILAYVVPPLGIVALSVGFAWLTTLSLPGALAVYIIAAPFPFGLTFHHHHLNLSDVMAIMMAIRLAVSSWREHRESLWQRWMGSPFWRPMVLLLVLSVLSLASALAPGATVIKIFEYVEFFVVLVAITHEISLSEDNWKLIMGALFAVAALLAIYGLYQFLFQIGPAANIVDVHHVRADAVFGQPNPFGGFESMVFAFVAALMGYGPKWARSWWAWGVAALVALSVIASFSRGAWVASVAAIGFMGVVAWALRGREMINRHFVIPGILVPIMSFGAIYLLGKTNLSHSVAVPSRQTTGGRLSSTVTAVLHPRGHFDMLHRLYIWKDALNAMRQHPMSGVGLGGFHRYSMLHPVAGLVLASPTAQNLYLEWGADLGVLGIVAALWLEWSWIRHSLGVLKARAETLTPFQFAMGLGAFGAIVSFVVHDWVDLMIDHGVIVPLVLGLAVVWLLKGDRQVRSAAMGAGKSDGSQHVKDVASKT